MPSLVMCVFSLGLAVGVVIAVGMLFVFQVMTSQFVSFLHSRNFFFLFKIRSIIRNRTGIEDWIVEKARYRREQTGELFVYPYDLGRQQNIQQVLSFSCAPIGDGIDWQLADGCDQYTLTVCKTLRNISNGLLLMMLLCSSTQSEQIAQKAEKRARSRTYTIVRPASGSWLPLWSQGFAVCMSPPCTDEPRIVLAADDLVKVTRWKK